MYLITQPRQNFIAVPKALCEDVCIITLCIKVQREMVHRINALRTRDL